MSRGKKVYLYLRYAITTFEIIGIKVDYWLVSNKINCDKINFYNESNIINEDISIALILIL